MNDIYWARNNDVTVYSGWKSGASAEAIICALVEDKRALVDRLVKLDGIAPKKIKTPDGRTLVYHCPDDLIPLTEL